MMRLRLQLLDDRNTPAAFAVSTTANSGAGSLRQAILDANAASGVDTITFDSTLFATPHTIALNGSELLISDSVTITNASGPVNAVITGGNLSRVLELNGTGTLTINITGITFTGGLATAGSGGGIFTNNENLSLDYCVISGNSAANGGGIGVGSYGGTLTINHSTISGNTAHGGGGIGFEYRGGLTLLNSTISGNTATPALNGSGGGVYLIGSATGGFTVRNSTVSGNIADTGGGFAFTYQYSGTLTFQNSTISGNSAAGASTGGGGLALVGNYGQMSLSSCIVSGNTSGTVANDVYSGSFTPLAASFCAFATTTGLLVTGSNNLPNGSALALGPLADNGGPVMTHVLGTSSAALNKGTNPASLTTDARGVTRVVGTAIDIGAVERQAIPTVASISVNGGSAQRSRLTTLAVTFSGLVNLATTTFTLSRPVFGSTSPAAAMLVSGTPAAGQGTIFVAKNSVANQTVATLAFGTNAGSTNGVGDGVEYGSLSDGSWTLTVVAAGVTNYDGTPMAAPYLSPTTGTDRIYRLFGDNDGDADTDTINIGQFRSTFGSLAANMTAPLYNPNFDYDGDGDIDSADAARIRLRFGLIV